MILDTIAQSTRLRVARAKAALPIDELKKLSYEYDSNHSRGDCGGVGGDDSSAPTPFPFEQALRKPGLSFICEVKKASPSKGLIAADFDPLAIAREYQAAGADAISVLTEPDFFLGDDSYLSQIASHVPLPVLRKDFTVDAYQIYEAKILGASAVLLICALLQQDELAEFIDTAHALGLSALVEAHSANEVRQAVAAGAHVIGINNRDLQTFTVDLDTTRQLAKLVPDGCLSVSESGIRDACDIKAVRDAGVDAVLIGETLMRASDRANSLTTLKGGT